MLMVVFGAGASYDSIPSRSVTTHPNGVLPDRLPLANQLFDDRPKFVEVMEQFPECQSVIPRLRNPNRSVEDVLKELQDEADALGDRLVQLTAIRFYLRYMIGECELRWNQVARGITSYKALLDEVHFWLPSYKQVYLVTFNYDTMLETALKERLDITLSYINDYTALDAYKVIKLHGSVNWGREIDGVFSNLATQKDNEVAREIIQRISALSISQRYQVVTPSLAVTDKPRMNAYFPAIAIPVEGPKDYECPRNHAEMLQKSIPKVTKLLVIGWRAMEKPFLGLLSKLSQIPQRVSVMIVSGSEGEAGKVKERLNAAFVGGRFILYNGGFTQLIVSPELRAFLSG